MPGLSAALRKSMKPTLDDALSGGLHRAFGARA
jgi:hypothetical protein